MADSKLPVLRKLLESQKQKLDAFLPRGMSVDRFSLLCIRAASEVPALLQADQGSLLLAISKAAELGLEPNGSLGHGWLIPYQGRVQFIVGYRGLIDLAIRSGKVKSISARVVHDGDTFDVEYGLVPVLSHIPNLEEDEDDDMISHAYAIARLADDQSQFEVMPRRQIDAVMANSPSAKGEKSPWHTHYGEMARKTVVRRLAKYLPLRDDLWAKALEEENSVTETSRVFHRPLLPQRDDQVTPEELKPKPESRESGQEG